MGKNTLKPTGFPKHYYRNLQKAKLVFSSVKKPCFLCVHNYVVWMFSSVQFGHSVVPYSLWPHELQHARLPCPSPTPRVYPNSCPLSQWCHPTIPSCRPLLLLPSIFPIIRVFSNESALCISWPKYWGFSLNISPSQWILRTDFLRMDWLDLLTVQVVKQEIARVNVNILGIHT